MVQGVIGMFKNMLIFMASFFILAGCPSESTDVELRAFMGGTPLAVFITKTEYNGSSTFVYGKLSATGLGGRETLDISKIELSSVNTRSSAIYVDSVAHHLVDRIPVVNGTVSINVYWVFDGELSASDKRELKLVVNI